MSKYSKNEVKPKTKDTKISSADDPTKTSDIELDEEGLKQVSGGKKHVANIKWTPGSSTL